MTTSTDLKTFKIAKGTKAQIVTAYNNGDIGDTDFAIATDEDYADIDLSNISNTGKTTVIGWGMPDYSAGVDISGYKTVGNQFTAPKDGFLSFVITSNSYNYAYIDNVAVCAANNNDTYARASITLPIGKGQTFYCAGIVNMSGYTSQFFPVKGE